MANEDRMRKRDPGDPDGPWGPVPADGETGPGDAETDEVGAAEWSGAVDRLLRELFPGAI